MPTIFTRIIAGEIPGTFVWKDDQVVAFLSINPIAPGHVLVVPRTEIDHWIECSPELSHRLFEVAHVIGSALQAAFDCERVGLVIAGYEVPHTHVHVIPTEGMHHLSFTNAASSVSRDDLESWADRIRVELRAAGRNEVV